MFRLQIPHWLQETVSLFSDISAIFLFVCCWLGVTVVYSREPELANRQKDTWGLDLHSFYFLTSDSYEPPKFKEGMQLVSAHTNKKIEWRHIVSRGTLLLPEILSVTNARNSRSFFFCLLICLQNDSWFPIFRLRGWNKAVLWPILFLVRHPKPLWLQWCGQTFSWVVSNDMQCTRLLRPVRDGHLLQSPFWKKSTDHQTRLFLFYEINKSLTGRKKKMYLRLIRRIRIQFCSCYDICNLICWSFDLEPGILAPPTISDDWSKCLYLSSWVR